MLWYILAGLIALAAVINMFADDIFGLFETIFMGFVFFLLFCALGGMVATGINAAVFPLVDKPTQRTEQLVNLNDAASISGRFFLGSGYIEGDAVFRFYTKDDAGFYTLNTVPADHVRVQQGDPNPRVVIRKNVTKNSFLSVWYGSEYYDFYVPEGSITNEIALDAK